MYFKNAIDALGHTPLVELTRMHRNQKVHILAKLEGQNGGGSASVKDRIAKYMLDEAKNSGKLTHARTIIEATSGNTGIALAWLGYQRGYKVTIVMPDSMSQERQQLMRIFGAEIILTPGAHGMMGAINAAQELAAKDRSYFMPDQFSNPANPLAHYETTGVELLNDLPYDPDALVVGIGTGGTIMGISRRLRERYPRLKVVGVEPPENDPIQGLKYVSGDYLPPVLDLTALSQKVTVTSQQAAMTCRQLLKAEGVFAGLSSGAAVYQAVRLSQEMFQGTIVVILPDGGLKYLSLDFWTKGLPI